VTTIAKPKHKEARALYLKHLDLHPGKTVGDDLDPLEAGIVGDPDHDGGYHISREDNDADDYSVDESSRDRRGRSDYASAMDIGYFKVTTRKGTFDLYDYNAWLVGLCKANDPDTRDLREVIYSLDGRTVKRWDRLGKRSSGDSSHTWHTHLSEHRDADGHRMVNLARRWLQHIGLIETEDDVTKSEFMAWFSEAMRQNIPWTSPSVRDWAKASGAVAVDDDGNVRDMNPWAFFQYIWFGPRRDLPEIKATLAEVRANLQAMAGQDWIDEQQVIDGVLAGLGGKDLDEAVAALAAAFGDRAAELAARLAAATTTPQS
jgi:hypothetical protein